MFLEEIDPIFKISILYKIDIQELSGPDFPDILKMLEFQDYEISKNIIFQKGRGCSMNYLKYLCVSKAKNSWFL